MLVSIAPGNKGAFIVAYGYCSHHSGSINLGRNKLLKVSPREFFDWQPSYQAQYPGRVLIETVV
jgi:hypothetical protein